MTKKKIVEEEIKKEEKVNDKEVKVKEKSGHIWLAVIITVIVCFGLFFAFYKFYLKNLVVETTKLVKDVTITDKGIADAVEKVYDSVVVVQTYSRGREYASGTGFVYKTDNKNGYIMTNYHVISNSSEVKVKFSNEKMYDATVVGYDEYADIAILSVEKDAVISVAIIGNSEELRVGDTTFAVGAPLDSTTFSWSVTRGILSGKNRIVETEDSVIEVLQTDTAINSGNSGGPLCNSNGEVIGITNMKLASSSIEGMGFAIPIEEGVKYADSIISGKKIARPYLGVSIYDSYNIFSRNDNSGVFIEYVEKGSAADKAGLKSGDKILKVNDSEIKSASYFKYELFKYNIGDKINITIERNGKEQVVKATLGTNSNMN
ncbi:MAG: trypsin-like peptidase domain-containing protein [Bacilli bacterium]|nr:trypsin-like peptidase domain-containing protein [Bacilli bacterium]